jgi:hypothetical protein
MYNIGLINSCNLYIYRYIGVGDLDDVHAVILLYSIESERSPEDDALVHFSSPVALVVQLFQKGNN